MVSVLRTRETPIDYIWMLLKLDFHPDEYSDYNERRAVHCLFYLAQKIGFFSLFSFTDGTEGPFSSDAATLIPELPDWKVVWEEWDTSNAEELWPKLTTLITPPDGVEQQDWIRLLGNYIWFYDEKNLGREKSVEQLEATFGTLGEETKNRLRNSLFYLKVQA